MCTKLQIIWTCSFRDDFNNFSKSEDLLMVVLFFAMSNFCRGCNKHHSCNVWLQLIVFTFCPDLTKTCPSLKFLAHLAERSCELLPSLGVCRLLTFYI
jgi:hypothetical protein